MSTHNNYHTRHDAEARMDAGKPYRHILSRVPRHLVLAVQDHIVDLREQVGEVFAIGFMEEIKTLCEHPRDIHARDITNAYQDVLALGLGEQTEDTTDPEIKELMRDQRNCVRRQLSANRARVGRSKKPQMVARKIA